MGRAPGWGSLSGFAVAAGGGPLAVATVYLLGVGPLPLRLLVPTAVLGVALFLVPVTLWSHFAASVDAPGGQYAFVRAAWGERAARVQGGIWTFAYLLYLPYTVTYIVYYLLPVVRPVPARGQVGLELLLPVVLSLPVLAGTRVALRTLTAVAVLQLGGLLALAVVLLRAAPAPAALWTLPPPYAWLRVLAGAAQIAALLVCLSLVLYLGGRAGIRGALVGRALWCGYGVLAASTVLSAWALAGTATLAAQRSELPGEVLARTYGPPSLALGVGLLALLSVAGVIVAEYVALVALWQVMGGWSERRTALGVGLLFLVGDALSLLGPRRFYNLTLPPSMVALYLAELMVFLAYPAWRRRWGPLPWADLALVAGACLWCGYALYGALHGLPA